MTKKDGVRIQYLQDNIASHFFGPLGKQAFKIHWLFLKRVKLF